jgi:acetyl esterase/lipase
VRDILLSNTVRTHTKLLEAGTEAELIVFEGMSHADYLMEFASPEHQLLLNRLEQYCARHLQGSTRRQPAGPDRVDSVRWA